MTTTTTGNSRIRVSDLGVRIERIATETHIFYDPKTQGATIVFQGEEYMTSADGAVVYDKIEGRAALPLSLASIAAETYDAGVDPVTGADLTTISPAGVAAIIRAVFNKEHNDAAGAEYTSSAPMVKVVVEDEPAPEA